MDIPVNTFKRALMAGESQIGLWCSLPGGYAAECVAGAGYDWLMFDTEHSPSDPLAVLEQLQAVEPYPCAAVVRPAANDPVLIKRFLDLGAQTLLIPMVNTVEDARAAVLAMRYPPEGIRGVSALTRATRFGRVKDYTAQVEAQLCLLVQVETREALDNIEAIAAVEGVDGIFIGPADLAASLGHIGKSGHPEVVAAIEDAVRRIRAAGRPAGILSPDTALAKRCLDWGTTFTAVGVDAGILARQVEQLLLGFRTRAG